MKTKILPFRRRLAAGVMLFAFASRALANPTGLSVSFGSALAQQIGSQLNVTAGNNAVLNWQSFNIAAGETTVFNQPSASSIVWNRVNDPHPSQIFGSLQANGVVVLLNSSGFYFGPNSFVSAAGLVISTANCVPPQNSGGSWEFNGPPPLASIVNYGHIQVGNGGSAFLIADKIENHGDIEAPGGSIGLAAGQTVTLSERPDGRGMSMNVLLPQGSVDNFGNLVADAGTVALNAKVVNQNGLIQADSVQNQNGVIELVASDSLSLGADSKICANGDNSAGGSAGGYITLKSENSFNDVSGSEISVAGGTVGGNGGAVEISAPVMPALNTKIDGCAQAGSVGGKLLLDPDYIVLDATGSDSVNGNGTVSISDSLGGALHLNVGTAANSFSDSAFMGLSQITLQAKFDIMLADGTSWNLSDSTGQSSGQLALEAGRNIIFGNTTSLYDLNNWSIALYAGVSDFSQRTVMPGGGPTGGSIYLNAYDPNHLDNVPTDPSGYIKTASGSITMVAGQDIIVGTGYVNTTGGGSINAHALAGSIDTGGYAQGYIFQAGDSASEGYYVDPTLGVGGISTTAGGDVNLTAGVDVNSLLPGKDGYHYDLNFISSANNPDITTAGSGAYGFGSGQVGNVNIVAGGNVTGNYLVANGVGKIFAGVAMDANGNPVKDASGTYVLGSSGSAGTDKSNPNLALNLISGGWNVTAAQNIILQEVRNPNGDFNVNSGGAFHTFDYAPSDFVNLTAGNLVQLGASSSALPRLNGLDSRKVSVIYPGILNIMAGAGGVVLDGDSTYNQLIIFPSPQGSLTITTMDGGSLGGNLPTISGVPQFFSLIVSDSGSSQYKNSSSFGLSDHASIPIHLGSSTPIELNISGDMNFMLLGMPEAAQINVGGNMNNCSFQGMNLSAGDTTSINVTGDIINRSAFTSVDLNQISGAQADLSLLSQAVNNTVGGTFISAVTLATSFYYNPTTKILTYQNVQGLNLASALQLLQHLTIQKVGQNGNPLWLDPEGTIPDTTTVSVLNSATAQALLAQYNALGAIPSGALGYIIGGGGKFDVSARNMDLGTTPGIQSKGVGLYRVGSLYPLADPQGPDFTLGADILVNLTGDLNMYSSSIASLNGGNIYVNAGGNINVGSSEFSVSTLGARGIYTTGQGNVAVYAGGDIDVNGSRIAAYDVRPADGSTTSSPGGSVTVVSRNGNINAGSGGSGFVNVSAYLVDSTTHEVSSIFLTIPGSGILDTSYTHPGNILVETPNGKVNAGAGGIVQLLLNNPVPPETTLFDVPLNLDGLAGIFRLALKGNMKAALDLEHKLNGISGNSQVDVYAGYELQKLNGGTALVDNYGNPVVSAISLSDGSLVKTSDNQDIDATGSGVIGAGSVNLDASGSINGNIFALNNVNINAVNNVNVSVLGLGNVSVNSAAGTISGTIIGVGGVSASGSSIDANLESNGSVSGNTSGEKGLAAGTAADATAMAASASDDFGKAAKKSDDDGEEDPLKKKKEITLAQKVSRVTVLLPAKN